MLIRRASSADVGDVIRIWKEGAQGAHPGLLDIESMDVYEHFAGQLAISGDVFGTWIAEAPSGEILGWQSLLPCRNSPLLRDSMAECSIYASRAARGHGVGRALMAATMSHALVSPLRYLIGYVADDNRRVVKGATRIGWRVVATLPGSPKLSALKPWHILILTVPKHVIDRPDNGIDGDASSP